MTTDDRTSAPDPSAPLTLRLRTPDDLLATVPVVLGFEPRHSLVLLSFGAGGGAPSDAAERGPSGRGPSGRGPSGRGATGPHLRIGLPAPDDPPTALAEIVEAAVAPCRRHGVASVAAVVYTPDPQLGAATAARLEASCAAAGISVLALLRADGEHWYAAGDAASAEGGAAPYRNESHPVRAAAVLHGRVVLGSREELANLLAPAGDEVRGPVAAAVAARGAPRPGPAESRWVGESVARAARSGRPLAVEDAARLLVALRLGRHRDAAWAGVGRGEAAAHVEVWLDLVRRAPDGWRSGPAALAALTAWLDGSGALAWCAVDVCLDEEPGHPLGRLVRDFLEAAAPPSWWEEVTGALGDPA
ncbi:DUF4192 domain-containing protein [Nocardioides zeae]|uniref:DUF4192 domain-containing protein n=1 Tax=Nocardioides zeae TaxID=1457234 RepID=A0A6P0HMD6_9ACTN|nr:DUF4192 domain-containing protein [Nocardioides zeae]NEN79377.1 DUF4192 domain-containing protein [Nocardioides zeae]